MTFGCSSIASCTASACQSGKRIVSLGGVHFFLSSLRQSYCPRFIPLCRDSYGESVRTLPPVDKYLFWTCPK